MENDANDDGLELGGVELSDAGVNGVWLIVLLTCGAMAVGLIAAAVKAWDYVQQVVL